MLQHSLLSNPPCAWGDLISVNYLTVVRMNIVEIQREEYKSQLRCRLEGPFLLLSCVFKTFGLVGRDRWLESIDTFVLYETVQCAV